MEVAPVETRFGAIGWTGVGIAILGAGGLGAAGFFANEADKAQTDANKPIDRETYDDLKKHEEESKEFGQIALYAGGGLLVIGAGLIAWDLATIETEDATVSFNVGANRLSVSATF